jgi:hypothetical protein
MTAKRETLKDLAARYNAECCGARVDFYDKDGKQHTGRIERVIVKRATIHYIVQCATRYTVPDDRIKRN